MFERCWTPSLEAAALVDRICAASRAENQAAGRRLTAIAELDGLRAREHEACERWTIDTVEAVSAEVAAALRIGQGLASSYLHYAQAKRDRLPRVGELLEAGDISYGMFQTIVYRTELITDSDVMATVDATLAVKTQRWPSMTRSRLAAQVDRIVGQSDPDAVRRHREAQADRELSIWDNGNGLAEVFGRLITIDAHTLDARLDALAATVCHDDPRTRNQRRADAMGAFAAGADRLQCRCGLPECPAAAAPAPKSVLIHVIAEQASLDGAGHTPGSMIDADALIPAEMLAELARSARLRPLVHPADTPPESGYVASTALADFVRCRDLTCRFPGCDAPATECDLDHTIPFADGGPTHASNLKTLCRKHHLLKTFWGWHDQQLPDGTVIWTAPSKHTYVTIPGSALLFPGLCVPTGELEPSVPQPAQQRTDRTAMMPQRRHTRAQNHTRYVAAERCQNRRAREALRPHREARALAPAAADSNDDDPPPF